MSSPAANAAPGVAADPWGAGDEVYAVHGVSRSYGAVLANDDISLSIRSGEIFGLLGPNGAGKSTLVRILVGLLRPDRGTVAVLGHDLATTPDAAARAAAYLAQDEPALSDLTPATAMEVAGRLRGQSRVDARRGRDALLDELDLGPLADRVMSRLSGGERRLAAVGTALMGDRPVLLLDEPTTGLDPVARRTVWTALERRRAAGATVLLVTHNVLEAETVLDRVAVLERGRLIACDTPGRLKAAVSDEVRLELVWRHEPPLTDATVAALAPRATQTGRRWNLHLPAAEARRALGKLMTGAAFLALDDFTLATPTLEDVYLALGGQDDDLERA